jgi:uncharacterized membrane protein
MSRTAIGLLAVVVISSIYFPVAAAVSKTTASGLGPELNSLSFLERHDPDELNVITDITSIATKDDVLVEAVGGSYTDFGRISEGSGVPTIIGWVFHETQWHGSDDLFADREDDVRDIYTTDDSDELQRLIAKYDLTMVVVGPRETSTYGNIELGMFDTLGDRVIEHGKYTVFSIDN